MLELSRIDVGEQGRQGELCTASGGQGVVMFIHANGSSESNARSVELARRLQQYALSTLLFDLLTPQEAADSASPLDIDRLARRVLQAIDALPAHLKSVPVGLFASGKGTAAALLAQTLRPDAVSVVVSRGGRPDLAGASLAMVSAPTLLMVGAADTAVLELNRQAYAQMHCPKRIEVVACATHLFLEAGALDAVTRLAVDWFCTHLRHRP